MSKLSMPLKISLLIVLMLAVSLSIYIYYQKVYLKNDCSKHGGRWQQSALGFFCNMPTADAGKSCTDSDQCESVCIANGANIGKCYEWRSTASTCLSLIEDGKGGSAVCKD